MIIYTIKNPNPTRFFFIIRKINFAIQLTGWADYDPPPPVTQINTHQIHVFEGGGVKSESPRSSDVLPHRVSHIPPI